MIKYLLSFTYKIGKPLVFFLFFIIFLGCMSSCKSHKKNKVEEPVYIGEIVEVKKEKKDKKKKNLGEKIADEAQTWLGTPYGYGKSEKGIATDCSGLVVVVFEKIADKKLPRNSAQQAEYCDNLKEKDAKAGDLVFFATGKDNKKVSHVGVLINNEKFVHASASKGVIISEMTTPYYQRTFIKYGRVPGVNN